MKIHHAPWSKWLKTMCYKGTFAYELQIGPAVIQWFYEPFEGRRLRIWRDQYWRR